MVALQSRWIRGLIVATAAVAAFFFLAPRQLGGWASYAIVSGTSMLPTLQEGDLVMARERPQYEVGDIVLFEVDGGRVIHRIVGESEEGFIVQGDNKPRVDNWTPDHDEILGSQVVRVPRVGRWIYDAQQNPYIFGALLGGLGSLGIAGTRRRRRRAGAHIAEGRRRLRPANSIPRRSFTGAAVVVAMLGVLGLAAGVFLTLLVVQPARVSQTLEVARFTNTAQFEVVATMAPSVVYSDPTLAISPDQAAPQPIYANLLRSLEVDFGYAAEGAEGSISGAVSARLRIEAGEEGWVKDIDLMAAQPFDGTVAASSFVISWPQVMALIQSAEEQIGWAPLEYSMSVLAEVDISGDVDGPVDERFVAELPMRLAGNEVHIDSKAMTVSEPVTDERPGQVPSVLRIASLEIPVERGRPIAAVAFGAIVLSLVIYLWWLSHQAGDLQIARIRMMYGSMIASVVSIPQVGTRVAMSSMADLVRLARKNEQMILYQRTRNEHRFCVPDGNVTYEYIHDSRRYRI